MVNAPAAMLFPMTDADGVMHLITEDAMATGRPLGCYLATCGTAILATSLTTPERGHCQSCRQGKAAR